MEEEIRELMAAVREELEEGVDSNDNLAGSLENPCCDSCQRMYRALKALEAKMG